MAPESLAAHATLFHRTDRGKPQIPERHHLEWIRFMQARRLCRWLVVIAPPGYAKSRWFSIAYPSWRIGVTKGRIRIGLVSNSGGLAEDFGRSVADAIESDRYKRVYGIGPDFKQGWSQSEMWTTGAIDKSNPNLACAGITGFIQGRRFDEIILDDPTKPDEARSPTLMEHQRFLVKSTLLERFPPGLKPPDGEGRMMVVLTRWSSRDLVETFREIGFKVVTMPALGYWDRTAKCSHCGLERDTDPLKLLLRCEHCDSELAPEIEWGRQPLWPEMESERELLRQREEDPLIFDLVKQGDPKVLSGDVFEVDKLNFGEMPSLASFTQIVQFVDTAGGKDRKRGDYFVIATIGIRGDEVWVLDIVRERLPAPKQLEYVIEHSRTLHGVPLPLALLCIEDKNEGIALYQTLLVHPEAGRLPLKPVSPQEDKEWRARPFAAQVNAGKVWIPSNKDGVPVRWARSFLAELEAFPNSDHDDQVDAASAAFTESSSTGPRIRVLRRGM